jgi:hypothetical protein
MDSFIFNGNTDTPESVARRRQVADALAARIFGQAPQNVGSGIAAIGQALIARQMGQEADASEAAGRQGANAAFAPILGGGASPTPAAAPVADAGTSAPLSSAISAASSKYGVDPSYLTRVASVESGGDVNAANPNSSARGPFQFINSTAQQYGLTNPNDPVASADAAARLTLDNRNALTQALGREPTQGELYLAHQQGAGGAIKILQNPNAPVSSAVGDTAAALNGGAPGMTGGQFAQKWTSRFPGNAAAPAQVAQAGQDSTIPANAQPAQGFAIPGQPASAQPAGKPTMQQLAAAISNPWLSKGQQAVATALYQQRLKEGSHSQETDNSGNIWDVNRDTGQKTLSLKKDPTFSTPFKDPDGNLVQRDATGRITVLNQADKAPTSVSEYKFYRDNLGQGQEPMDYATWSTAKARAGASNISNNIDMNSGQTYDKQLAEGLGKSHASLANGVEDAKSRARDVAAMQGAIDQIQKNGGTTGGMGQSQMLELKKTINSGAAALGINTPFNENDISDKEFLTKFNRQMAGAQAKGAVGSRVTNFEMSNYLKANPGLDMSVTGNQRLLGIQAQIEQRNVAVGNAIREATAAAISGGKKIDPVTVQKIITQYDEEHHVQDPISGQDLTQSYTLPEFQGAKNGTNSQLEVGHEANIAGIKIKRVK